MKRVRSSLIIVLLLMVLAACATLQDKWDKATEQERAQIIIGSLQDTLNMTFDTGKLYVVAHPDKSSDWRNKIIPMFDTANKILNELEKKGKAGELITVSQVNAAISGRISDIQNILIGWGVKLK